MVSRCAASSGDSPRDVNVSIPSTRGALEAFVASASSCAVDSSAVGTVFATGLYEKSDEITSLCGPVAYLLLELLETPVMLAVLG